MKTTAIIAEYNPFHNGHLYQINETRRRTDADFILVIMSGDFVQRGAPALCNKYIRTRMALAGGADAVIELPSLYALSSAEFFAGGAVALLNLLGVADTLSFGSESGDLSAIDGCARLLAENPSLWESELKNRLKKGCSYPAAMAQAVSKAFPGWDGATRSALFSSPNNILGLEYCKALNVTKSSIRPFTLKREGGGYHDLSLKKDVPASASAIRNALAASPEAVRKYVPDEVYRLLEENNLLPSSLTKDAFSGLLHYKLLMEREQGFAGYLDCTPDLSDKICKSLPLFAGFTDFCRLLKSREVTYARISRVLMHILLNIKTPDCFKASLCHRRLFVPYARLLGFRREASPLLAAIKKSSSIPLLSKPADAGSLLDGRAFSLFRQDIFCASVYESVQYHHTGRPALNEMKQSPVIF